MVHLEKLVLLDPPVDQVNRELMVKMGSLEQPVQQERTALQGQLD